MKAKILIKIFRNSTNLFESLNMFAITDHSQMTRSNAQYHLSQRGSQSLNQSDLIDPHYNKPMQNYSRTYGYTKWYQTNPQNDHLPS